MGGVGAHRNTETAPSGPAALNGADGADRVDRSNAADPHVNGPCVVVANIVRMHCFYIRNAPTEATSAAAPSTMLDAL